MREIVSPGIKLFVITVVAAALLGLVSSATKGPIEVNSAKAKKEAMAAVLTFVAPENFGEEIEPAETDLGVVSYSVGYAGDGSTPLGYVVMIDTKAEGYAGDTPYGGKLLVAVGIDDKGIISGVKVLEHSETPGLGAHAAETGPGSFIGQFAEKAGPFTVRKAPPFGENDIAAITSATITSRAVTSAVNNALEFYNETIMKGGV